MFFDPDKMHTLNHKGKYLSVHGPLNIARPVQGWPVIVQAGASDAGRQLAAETAEMVFTALPNMKAGQAFCADVKGRMKKAGRNPEHMTIMPACFVMLGETKEEAKEKRDLLDSKVNYANAIASLSIALGHDASKFDPDKPLPDDIPESNASEERPRARHRARQAREPDRAPACAAARRLRRARHGRHGQDRRRRDGGMADDQRLRRLHHPVPVSARRARRFLRRRWCRSCSGAACSARNMKARRCARISGCRGRGTGSSTSRRRSAAAVNDMSEIKEYPRPRLLRRRRPARRRVTLCADGRQDIRRQGRPHARQSGRPASARKLPAHDRRASSSPTSSPGWSLNRNGLTVFTHAANRQRAARITPIT